MADNIVDRFAKKAQKGNDYEDSEWNEDDYWESIYKTIYPIVNKVNSTIQKKYLKNMILMLLQ